MSNRINIMRALLTIMMSLIAGQLSFAQEEAEPLPFIHTVTLKAESSDVFYRALIDTLNDYGYMIDAINVDEGQMTASSIDYASFYRGDKFSGINNIGEMKQILDAHIVETGAGTYDVSLRLTYKNDIVTVSEPYEIFVENLIGTTEVSR